MAVFFPLLALTNPVVSTPCRMDGGHLQSDPEVDHKGVIELVLEYDTAAAD